MKGSGHVLQRAKCRDSGITRTDTVKCKCNRRSSGWRERRSKLSDTKDLGLFLLFLTMCSNGCKEFAKVKCRRRRRQAARGEVEMKVKKLQRLVPGGEGLNPDRLFLKTADYILHLRLQVDVLQTLSKICKP
ncbi:hypothetical protein SO802_011713 [Lithocarpus litseifolius]|uniref:Uncharacterized protein n=1 Tax=Lithocarpus litseifolius TaxID=425828 RepID=A0AAW2D1F0_9ROSI